jgi:hypothetical protein
MLPAIISIPPLFCIVRLDKRANPYTLFHKFSIMLSRVHVFVFGGGSIARSLLGALVWQDRGGLNMLYDIDMFSSVTMSTPTQHLLLQHVLCLEKLVLSSLRF